MEFVRRFCVGYQLEFSVHCMTREAQCTNYFLVMAIVIVRYSVEPQSSMTCVIELMR